MLLSWCSKRLGRVEQRLCLICLQRGGADPLGTVVALEDRKYLPFATSEKAIVVLLRLARFVLITPRITWRFSAASAACLLPARQSTADSSRKRRDRCRVGSLHGLGSSLKLARWRSSLEDFHTSLQHLSHSSGILEELMPYLSCPMFRSCSQALAACTACAALPGSPLW